MYTAIANHQARDAVRHETALLPQVAEAGLQAAVAADQQPGSKQDRADNRRHLDDGETELGFTYSSTLTRLVKMIGMKK